MVEFVPDMKLDGQRAVEYPWVEAIINSWFVPSAEPLVLVIGAAELYFDPQTRWWAPQAVYTDARPCPEPCVIGNATEVDFGDMRFDVIHNISNLEHFGGGEYGVPYRGSDLDLAAVRNLNRFVASGGVHLLSVPFGKHTSPQPWRMYDTARIGQLHKAMLPLVPFEERYLCRFVGGSWEDTTPKFLADKPYHYGGVCGGFGVYLGAFTLPPMKWKAQA